MSGDFSPRLIAALRKATAMAALTGAGASAESGVPTFRGTDGIWAKFKPEELATMSAFLKNPPLVWEWYAHRRTMMSEVKPNPGHAALARMEQLVPKFAVITQNIDNLHRRAGSRTVYELHGNIERNYCLTCRHRYQEQEVLLKDGAPTCARCGGLVRPDVVWFGEMLPQLEWDSAVGAATTADVFLSIGTSAAVYPAASIPLMAKDSGAFLVEINPGPTPLTPHADEFLQGPSGVLLPEVCEILEAFSRERHQSPASPGNATR